MFCDVMVCEIMVCDLVCDIMDKAGKCGRIVSDVTSLYFLLSVGGIGTNMAVPGGAQCGSQKVPLFYKQ